MSDFTAALPDCRCKRTPSQRPRVDGGVDTLCACGVRERWSERALASIANDVAWRQGVMRGVIRRAERRAMERVRDARRSA